MLLSYALVVSVFARELSQEDGEDENHLEISGALCKPPVLRTTPLGRTICDMILSYAGRGRGMSKKTGPPGRRVCGLLGLFQLAEVLVDAPDGGLQGGYPMLDEQDLLAIAQLIDQKLEEKLEKKLDEKLARQKEEILTEATHRMQVLLDAEVKPMFRPSPVPPVFRSRDWWVR